MFNRNTMRLLGLLVAATLGLVLVTAAQATEYTWTPTAAGPYNWDDASSNWTSGFPNAVGDSATLAIDLAGAQTIDLNQAITIGTLNIGDTGSTYYATTLQNGIAGSLTFDASSGSAAINKAAAGNTATDIISATITLNDKINISNAATTGGLTISGNIGESGGARSLTKLGAGVLTLSGTNTYTGATTVNAGTLLLNSSANAIANGGLTINTGALVQYTGASTDMIGNTSAVTINGTAQLDFNGATDTIGNVTIAASGATAGTTPIKNTAGSGNLTIGTLAITPVAGFTSQVNSGTGTLTLGGDVTFTAATTGQAQISGNLALVTATRTFTINAGTGAGYDMLIDAPISGTVGLTKAGSGTLVLSGANTYAGGTTVNDGTLIFLNTAAKPGTGITTVAAAKTLGLGVGGAGYFNSTDVDNLFANTMANVTMDATSGVAIDTSAGDFTYATAQSTRSLTKFGANTLTLSGANTYTGATTVLGGTLKAGIASVANTSGAFGNNSAVTLVNAAGATLDITGFDTQIGSLTGGGAAGGNVTLGAATLTVGGNNATTTYSGMISSTGSPVTSLIKIGTGTLTLSGANTYTGATAVSAGTLTFAKRVSLYNDVPANWTPANITVESAATLVVSVGANASGYFDAADLATLLDGAHLGGSTAGTGLKSGAIGCV